MPTSCCAYGCTNHSKKSECAARNVYFHKFPLENETLLKAWVNAIKREHFKPNLYTKLCSDHFTSDCFVFQKNTKRRLLVKGAVPTIFTYKKKQAERQRTSYLMGTFDSTRLEDSAAGSSSSSKETQTAIGFDNLIELLYAKNIEIASMKEKATSFLNPLEMTDSELKAFSGFKKETFVKVYTFVNIENDFTGEKLTPLQGFFIFMIKLRTGMTLDVLAYLFKVSSSTVSRVFNKMTEILFVKLKRVNIWPNREQLTEYMPPQFKIKYPNCRIIIDCTEIFIQKPFNPKEQQLTFSNYKIANTMKALLGISPSGGISFISDLWCGSISDKNLFMKCKLLDLLEPGDVVLADKGFRIQSELENVSCQLATPIFLRDKIQFTLEERTLNKQVSHLRVHVERAICRIKSFKYFEGHISYESLHNLNEVFYIASFLTNFYKPLIAVEPNFCNDD